MASDAATKEATERLQRVWSIDHLTSDFLILLNEVASIIEERDRLAAALRDAESPERARFARIGELFAELWEAGAPWPVKTWTCDAHKVRGCLECKAVGR